jgi:exo-poly-alpha-galacturonosidase
MKTRVTLLFCALFGGRLLLAAPDGPPERVLFGPGNGYRLAAAESRGVEAAVADGRLQITASGSSEERRVLLPLARDDQDLSAYRYVEAEFTNRGEKPLIFTFWALSGNGWGGASTFPVTGHERETLAPGASAKYRIDLHARYAGSEVYTTATNPASVRWLAIACEEHRSPITLSVDEIRASGTGPASPQDISGRILVPDVTHGDPAPGRRVYQQLPGWEQTAVSHVLTLPRNWAPRRKFPIIVEYTGNRFFDKLCFSTGRTDQGNLAYGLSRGEDYICLNLPFISPDGRHEQIDGFGDLAKDSAYCVAAVKFVCDNYGGDPRAVFFTGFSRGASACNPLGLHDDQIASLWCGFITDLDPGKTWLASDGKGWRNMGLGWNDRAARLRGRPWFYQPAGFGPDVHVDVEFLEDRPSTIATRKWMQEVLAAKGEGTAGPGSPLNLFLPPQTGTEGSITLMWDKPEAYADVADYAIFCDGRQVAVTSKTNGTVGGLEPDRGYSFYVEARDVRGRASAPSQAIEARTRPVGAKLNILAYGAVGDGRTKNTAAIQRAIDACPTGGTVVVPSGVFLTGALFLKSDLTLLVEAGARLQGTTDVTDYQPMIRSRFEGWELDTFASLINAGRLDHAGPCNVRNIAIRGEGEIRGGGNALAHAMIAAGGLRSRGRLICIVNCSGLDLQGLTIDDPPCWTIQYVYSEKISCHDLTIRSTVANGDGMDPDSSRDCFIFNCSFSNGDDCIAIKSGKNPEGNQIGRPTENVRITDCTFLVGHGISIGSEISGSVRHVLVRDCDTGNLLNGLQIKGTPERGGVVEDVRVQDCRVRKIRVLTKLGYNNDGAAAPEAPYFKNFTFVNIDLRQAGVSSPVIVVDGYDDGRHRTQDLLFQGLQLPDGASVDVDQCENVKFIDVATVDGAKPAYHVTRSQGIDD